ncbi:MAG: MFS transporter [Chloroflexi bacterium]|nr:MFS transporter [Chloroflexota bacterium]
MFWIKALYVLIYASYGATSSYLTLYFRRVGLTNAEIGILLAVQPLAMLVAGPGWSLLADRFGIRNRLLTLVLGLSPLPYLAMMATTQFSGLLALTVLSSVTMAPVNPLMDSAALAGLGAERHRYGSVRLWGSVGYAPVAWGTGLLIQAFDIRLIFVLTAVLTLSACLVSLRLTQDREALPTAVGHALGTLLRHPGWLGVMSSYFVAMVLQGVAYGFANLYMDQLGASEGLMGFAQALSSVGQILVMATVLPRALLRWGSERLLIVSLLFYGAKLGIWVVAPHPWAVGLSQLLNGVSFGAAAVAAVDYAARNAPPGLEVTSQSIATGLVSGLGRAAGSSLGGALYDGAGPRATFGLFTALGVLAAGAYRVLWAGLFRVRPCVAGQTAAVPPTGAESDPPAPSGRR